MHELRILNGLHRGATLPLDHSTLILGASEDADVVLVDPDIETRHAALTRTATGWTLSMQDGAVLSADSNQPQESLELQFGDFARIGPVWITVAEAEARWINPPPEPVDAPQEEATAEAGQAQASDALDEETGAEAGEDAFSEEPEAALAQEALPAEDELYRDSPEDGPMYEEQAAPVPPAPQPAARRIARLGGWRRSRMIMVPLALATVLSACAAYTITATSEEGTPFKTAKASTLDSAQPQAAAAPEPKPEPIDLRAAFRQRLREVALLNRVDLDLREGNWKMHAALDDDEAARFERVLAKFISTHNITFPVSAKIGSAEEMLPFRIRQVISGSNASIITHDGNRLYVGDSYRGVRLVAIEGNQLRFDGERNIKVKW